MPIYPNPTSIAINNPILGRGTMPQEIGPISTELAIWLKARLDLHLLTQSTQDTDYINIRQAGFTKQETQDWDARCRLAAVRGYSNPYADESAQLTPLGIEVAKLIEKHFQDNMEAMQANPTVSDPDLWTKAEQVFIMGAITIRQANMIKLIFTACLDAERTNRLELDEAFKNAQTAERLSEETIVQEAHKLAKKHQKELNSAGAGSLLNVYAERQMHAQPQQFQARVFDAGPQGRDAYVPTAMFGQRARADLRNLIKYGLVDLKAFVTGSRGRPKHIVKISGPGIVVVKDLAELGII